MSRYLIHSLFVLALISFAARVSSADDADSGEPAAADAAAPSDGTASDEKDGDAAEAPKPPQPAEKPDKAAESEKSEDAQNQSEAPDAGKEVPEKEARPAGAETTATEQPLEPWQELHQQWLAIDKRLKDMELKYYHSSQDEQFEIRTSFEELIEEEAIPLLAELRNEVIDAYQAKPNEDVRLVKLLIGFMVNHARMGEEAEAKEVIELLIENKADQKYVTVAAKAPGLKATSLDILDRMVKRYQEVMSPEDERASTTSSGGEFDIENEKPAGSEQAATEEGATSEKKDKTEAADTEDE